MTTIVSRSTSYLAAADFLKRADKRVVAQLCTDDIANPVAATDLATNDFLIEALRDASGLFESAVLMGERYTVEQLTAIADPDNKTNATGLLYRILSDVTIAHLYELRPELAPSPAMAARIDRAMRWMDELSNGKKVFGLPEAIEAGHMQFDEVDPNDREESYHGQTKIAKRFFGNRSDDYRGR